MATRKAPALAREKKPAPSTDRENRQIPEVTEEKKATPEVTTTRKEAPPKGHLENMIMFGSKMIEIKETKVKYQRDRTAAFYRLLELYPLVDILGMDKGSFGDDRDGDKAVFDWLIAVTDDPKLVEENYDELDSGTIEKLLAIFRRVNKIDDKEEKLKNVTAPGAKKD